MMLALFFKIIGILEMTTLKKNKNKIRVNKFNLI